MEQKPLKKALIDHIEDLVFFLEFQGANPFKIRAFEKAIDILDKVPEAELNQKREGIGKGILGLIEDFTRRRSSQEFEEASEGLPLGLLELKEISGLGAKKIKSLYDELQISSLGELEYACKENRLAKLKGFGEKTQKKIMQEIEAIKTRQGKVLLSDAFESTEKILQDLHKRGALAAAVGDLGSRHEVVSEIEILSTEKIKADVKIHLSLVTAENFFWESVKRTSSEQHLNSLTTALKKGKISPEKQKWKSEEEIYRAAGFIFYPPEAREFSIDPKSRWQAIETKDLTGVFHLHTTESDGINSLDEMASAARNRGWSFMGLSDHSQTSVYANGLQTDRLLAQWQEVEALNKKFKDFKILRGIESDILKDGSLDYPVSILKKTDFVIASIHTRYGMTEMTNRLIAAIENPYTSIIGHISGRLLLAREGYDFDAGKVVDAAISNKKVIELNSHPQRLDMDWRILHRACEKGLLISINPDAHSVQGFDDVRYGVWLANKALIPREQIINTWSVSEIEKFLRAQR